MSLTKEDLKNIKDLFKEKFESIEKQLEYLIEKGNLYELSFNKMNERLDCIDRNILELRARENLNRDILNSKEKEYSK